MANWIEEYRAEHKELPTIPSYLKETCNFQSLAELPNGRKFITPSGQLFNSWTPRQREKWRQLIEWAGEDPDGYEAHMRQMLPRNAPRGR